MANRDEALRSKVARDLSTFQDVLSKEYRTIAERRRLNGSETGFGKDGAPEDLFGVCLSGGGIRSASFCLGALQALDQYRLVKRMDYLSTVSGGGYSGASLAAAMGGRNETFPFSASPDQGQDVRDSEAISHIRDHSRFIAPRGLPDLIVSVAIALRGLMVNLILLMGFLTALATVFIAFNPAVADLGKSFVWDTVALWLPGSIAPGTIKDILKPYLSDPFLLSKVAGILAALTLVGWALRRSYVEMYDREAIKRLFEPKSRWTRWTQAVLACLCIALVIEIQPRVIAFFVSILQPQDGARSGLVVAWGSVASVVAATAAFRGTLMGWIQKALGSSKFGARLQGLLATAAFYAAGLALPLLIYGLFLGLVIWGVNGAYATRNSAVYDYLSTSPYPVPMLIGAIVLFGLGQSLIVQLKDLDQARNESALMAVFRSLRANANGRLYLWIFAFWSVVLILALLATRADTYAVGHESKVFCALRPGKLSTTCLMHAGEWRVFFTYLLGCVLLVLVGMSFTENANGLHRLYRDRLMRAFPSTA